MNQKESGILMHISSLPSIYGIGDLGPEAYVFADFLKETGQKYWQVLPMNPTDDVNFHSPYSSLSAFAGNTLFISPEGLRDVGFLSEADLRDVPSFSTEKVTYRKVEAYKKSLFDLAYKRFREGKPTDAYQTFIEKQDSWLNDYALFVVIKQQCKGEIWTKWPQGLKHRDKAALKKFAKKNQQQIDYVKFLQYIFFSQWEGLRSYCHQQGVEFIGDIPIYVTLDSVDVWENPQNFKLDDNLEPIVVAGVPPDYFSDTGQRWGNPVYDWGALQESHYAWWVERLRMNLSMYDVVRIDHFRGLVNYWEIPSSEPTAIKGQWASVPTDDFFAEVKNRLGGEVSVIAEDLGIITDDVREAMKRQGFPGMKILLFAFNGDMSEHPYLPHNFTENCVVYTGTHDNNTVQGWVQNEMTDQERENIFSYIGKHVPDNQIHWELIRMGMRSQAKLVITPLQDILGLGEEARMNRPATVEGNWQWRVQSEALTPSIANQLLLSGK